MKKTVSAATAALLALSLCMPVLAAEDVLPLPDAPVVDLPLPQVQKAYPVRMAGIITEETDESITVQNAANADDTIILHLPQTTCVVDAETGLPAEIGERTNDNVIVYYGPAATLSLPPQSSAVVVAVNAPEKGTSPHYAVAESVQVSEDGSAVKVLTDNGSLYVTIGRETPIAPYLTRNIVTIDNIREGSELLLWYDAVAMSYPAQTTALKTVILRDAPLTAAPDRIILSTDAGVASVNSAETDLVGIHFDPKDDMPLIPLRQICEALGYDVRWIAGTDKVEITRGETTVLLQFFSHTYMQNGLAVLLDHMSVVEKGVTYAPLCFFEEVLGVEVIRTTEGV